MLEPTLSSSHFAAYSGAWRIWQLVVFVAFTTAIIQVSGRTYLYGWGGTSALHVKLAACPFQAKCGDIVETKELEIIVPGLKLFEWLSALILHPINLQYLSWFAREYPDSQMPGNGLWQILCWWFVWQLYCEGFRLAPWLQCMLFGNYPWLCRLYVVAYGMRHDGWYGKVDLQRPKRTLGGGKDDEHMSLGQQWAAGSGCLQ